MISEPEYSLMGEPSFAMKLKKWSTTITLIVYGILLLVLFILYGTIDESSSSSSTSTVASFGASSSLSSSQVGYGASLDQEGLLQVGAGTSVYQDLYEQKGVCAKSPAMEPVFASSYVMTYIDGVASESTVSVFRADSARELHLSFSVEYALQLAALSTLDETGGLLVAVAQDLSEDQDEAVVVAMRVTDSGSEGEQSVVFGAQAEYGGKYSVNPQVTRLSATTFALTYIDDIDDGTGSLVSSALTRHGVVHGDLSVSLSPAVVFAVNEQYQLLTRVVGLGAESYMLVMNHALTTSDQGYYYGPLQARVATVTANEGGGTVNLGGVSTFATNMAAFNMGGARLDDKTALVTYCDFNNNFGISAVSLQVGSGGAVSVTAALALTSGQALATVDVWLQMDLDVVAWGSDDEGSCNQFLVSYVDVSNNGKLTAAAGRVSSSRELQRTSPDFLLGAGDTSSAAASVYQWHALAVKAGSGDLQAEVALMSSLQSVDCALEASSLSISSVHLLPAPVGVLHSSSAATLSGLAGGYRGLLPGQLYYTNTFGELTASGVYGGQEVLGEAVVGEDGELMTGLVGVAVSDSQLLLKV